MEANTRVEKLLRAIAEGTDVSFEPVTRTEKLLKKVAEQGGTGSGGGVTSWNDLTDRPFGEVDKVLLPHGEYTMEDWDGSFGMTLTEYPSIQVGDTVRVVWDGVEYTCEAKDFYGNIVFGNLAAYGGDNTGEPFMAVFDAGTFALMDMVTQATVVRNISITATTVKKLDVRYINAGLPVYCTMDDAGIWRMAKTDEGTDYYSASEITSAITSNVPLIFMESTTSVVYPIFVKLGVTAVNDKTVLYVYAKLAEETMSGALTVYTAEYTPESTASE